MKIVRVVYPHDFLNEVEATSSEMEVKRQKSPAVGFFCVSSSLCTKMLFHNDHTF